MTDSDWRDLLDAAGSVSAVHAKRDVVDRLEVLSVLPIGSQWRLLKDEIEKAVAEIRRLRRRIEELEGDGA
jgi:uncharacterized small protein (DUF1192 family)